MSDKLFKSRPMKESYWHPQDNPYGFLMAPVDIIIPFHGQHNKVGALIESIFNTVRTNRYQITLVDDGSSNDKFIKEFKKVPGVVAHRSDEQKGFGAAVNLGLKNTRLPFVLIMHSDVVVSGNLWLTKLGESFNALRPQNVKMISPRTDNPTGDDFLRAKIHDVQDDVMLPEGKFLPMYCALCSRGLFTRVGTLKEYPYAGGEAEEFAARMCAQGYRQGVSGTSWVRHEGRGTLSEYDKNKRVQDELQKVKEMVGTDITKLLKN